jgi:hypothetical protein
LLLSGALLALEFFGSGDALEARPESADVDAMLLHLAAPGAVFLRADRVLREVLVDHLITLGGEDVRAAFAAADLPFSA